MTMAGRGDRGQSTVEFAMILPLVALVLLLLVQAGLVVRDQLLVSHAAREVRTTARGRRSRLPVSRARSNEIG